MAQFFVVALFVFAVVIFVLDRLKAKAARKEQKNGVGGNRKIWKIDKSWMDLIPGPKPFPLHFIGNIFQLQPVNKSRRKFFEWCREFPTCFKFIAFNKAFVILNSPQLAHGLLKSTNIGHLTKSFMYDSLKPFMASGLIPASGHFWQHHRKILNRSMNYNSLRNYTQMLNYHSRKLVSNMETLFQDGQPHQINVLLNCTFLQVVCKLLTGPHVHVEDADVVEYHHNFQSWKAQVIHRLMKPWLLFEFIWKLHPLSKKYHRTVDKLHDFAKKVIGQHELYFRKNVDSDSNNNEMESSGAMGTGDDAEPFESMLSDLRRANVSEHQIMEEVNSLLLAGHETVATTMHFFCFLMALEPECQEACRKEVDGVFNDPMLCSEDGSLSYEALYELKYVERCLMETLRLFPPVFIYLRQLEAPFQLKIDENTVELPIGTNVVVVPAAIQMSPNYYPNPKQFNPDRFLPEEMVKRPIGSYIPFSGGPRGCLGVKFAMLELKMMAAYVLRRFQLKTEDKMNDIPIIPYVTLTPKRDYFFTVKTRDVN